MATDVLQSLEESVASLSSICASISMATHCSSYDIHHAKTVLLSLQTLGSKLEQISERSFFAHQTFLRQQERVQKCIRNVQSVISPARWLPHELVGEILRHYVSSEQYIRLPVRKEHPTPIFFAHVCQRWRTVALTSPKVWASLHVEIRQCFRGGYEKSISSLIDLCLQRSGNRSLNIRFTVFPVVTTWPRCAIREDVRPIGLPTIFLSLIRYSHKWNELWLDVSYPVLRMILRETPISAGLPVPLLRGFHLRGGIVSDDPQHIMMTGRLSPPFLDLSSAPSLCKLSLQGIGLLTAHPSAFPWRVLEDLSLGGTHPGMKFDDYTTILKQCIGLKRCQLSLTERTRATVTSHIGTIMLNMLESLHITEHSLPDGAGDLYRFLVCPNLRAVTFQYLILESEDDPDDLSWTTDSLTTFLDGSPLLTTLNLWNIPTSERELLDIFHHVPGITDLTLASWGAISPIGNQLLHELTSRPPPRSHDLLRQLKHVQIASRDYSDHFLFEFIKSRWIGFGDTVQIKEVKIHLLGNLSETRLRSRLCRFQEEGLKIVMINS